MIYFLNLAGVLQIVFGIFAAAAATSILQETVGAVSIGFGVLALGAAAIVDRLERLHREQA